MIIPLLVLFLAVSFLPGWWVRSAMRAQAAPRNDLPGTGGELAEHLVNRLELSGVRVGRLPEQVARDASMNYYDPTKREVMLAPQIYDGRSITAVAIAAHEVGHAIQHSHGEPLFDLRTKLVQAIMPLQRLASIALFASPILALVTRSPAIAALTLVSAVLMMLSAVVVHFLTLPVEIDASYRKALPILRDGGYISDADQAGARSVLRAAAFTYVAAAMMSLLNIGWWLRLFR